MTGAPGARTATADSMERHLSTRLRSFIGRNISSLEQVEILLLLRRSGVRAWSVDEISGELRSSVNSVRSRIGQLQRAKLVVKGNDERFCYVTGPEEDAVAELEYEYENRRVRLIEAIFSRPVDSARSFADAFRLWEKDDDR